MTGSILVLDKPAGWTSHDAVHRLRVVLGVKEVGHAGSLDPYATGVLVCGIGRGTKVLSYLMDLPKRYVGSLRLGRITDTGDKTGAVIEEREVVPIEPERIRSEAASFVGLYESVPPMMSAVKYQGKRLYAYARAGIEIERKTRTVEVRRFDITSIGPDLIGFRIDCGKGTYVRSLVQDLGERLGPGASVEELRRIAVGPFEDGGAVRIDDDLAVARTRCEAASMPLAAALAHLPAVRLRQSDWVRRVRQGGQPPWRAVDVSERPGSSPLRLLAPEGELIAIVAVDAIPGPIDRPWQDAWGLKLERVL
ncbi:MAG: tRNA pseudouridine(55) synthase TruB [Candidatus Eisenbacteria bacterium]|nr:tRNA pseudouridine(55) synthase TruB [Candidatus Eisenbacteria bacterium]